MYFTESNDVADVEGNFAIKLHWGATVMQPPVESRHTADGFSWSERRKPTRNGAAFVSHQFKGAKESDTEIWRKHSRCDPLNSTVMQVRPCEEKHCDLSYHIIPDPTTLSIR